MNPSLQGYAAAVLGPPSDLAAQAAELGAVEDLVRSNATMFTAMTDTALPAGARRGVLADVLEGRVREPVRRAAAFAAGAVAAPEVPAALSWLTNHTAQAAGGDQAAEPVLGHLAARERVGGFATAMYEELSTAQLEEVEDELFRFTRTVADTPSLRSALANATLPVEVRQDLVRSLLENKVEPATLRLVEYALAGGRARDLVGTLDWLVEQTAQARGWRVARVRSAQTLTDDEREELTRSLSELSGHPVEIQLTVEPELLAGVVVEIGDRRLEATARGQLDQLREHMMGGEWEDRGFGRSQPPDAA